MQFIALLRLGAVRAGGPYGQWHVCYISLEIGQFHAHFELTLLAVLAAVEFSFVAVL